MAAQSLVNLARTFWMDEDGFARQHPHAWFVWKEGRPSEAPIVQPTLTIGGNDSKPRSGDPLAIPILKGKASVFAMGITIGRTENNDVVLRHEEVSRFHAYVQDTAGALSLVDADSKNGTWVNGLKLLPSKPQPLPAIAVIKFGQLQITYYGAEAFIDFLRNP
ncbi:MAG: FHA domain-containing protein [Deltaproteobacteria bacterium]|nr:FHA domain-containing protein [Deltaproteobacteria bacterium]